MPDPFEAPFPQFPFISQHFTDVFKDFSDLTPTEAMIVERASAKRRSDFSTGRYCARQALLRLKNVSPEIIQGKGKEPIWPNGIVGSISHSKKIAGAVVALQHDVLAIGMDIETIGGVKPEMWDLIFHKAEQKLIQNKQGDQSYWATLLFSLKESFYKMQYPLTGQFLDFSDVVISETNGDLCFASAKPQFDLNAVGLNNIETHWTNIDNQLITLCYARA
jgi:4'-phosphopantetheinyl transferase EntD